MDVRHKSEQVGEQRVLQEQQLRARIRHSTCVFSKLRNFVLRIDLAVKKNNYFSVFFFPKKCVWLRRARTNLRRKVSFVVIFGEHCPLIQTNDIVDMDRIKNLMGEMGETQSSENKKTVLIPIANGSEGLFLPYNSSFIYHSFSSL